MTTKKLASVFQGGDAGAAAVGGGSGAPVETLAAVGALNAALQLAQRGCKEISVDEYTKAVKTAKGSDPNAALDSLLGELMRNRTQCDGVQKLQSVISSGPGPRPVGRIEKADTFGVKSLKKVEPKVSPQQKPIAPAKTKVGASAMALEKPAAESNGAASKSSGGKWDGPGMYLTYEPAANGTMYLVYSKENVAGAIAYAKPGKPIPGFKFNTLGGKTELVKGASDKVVFMRGVASFVKAAKAHSGAVDINEKNSIVSVSAYIYYDGDKVRPVVPGELTCTESLGAVAVVPQANADFKGVTTLGKALFVQRADTHGASAS